MKEAIKKFEEEKAKLKLRIKEIDNFIEAYQKICVHDMVYDGHDSHKSWYKCSICNKEDWS